MSALSLSLHFTAAANSEIQATALYNKQKLSPSNTEACCVCNLPAIEGPMLAAIAGFHLTCLLSSC
jgi:hypothetical protein